MDPYPIKHIGSLMKEVRTQVEPLLHQAGFTFAARNKPVSPGEHSWLDYERSQQVCRIRYNVQRAELCADLLNDKVEVVALAVVPMNRPREHQDILDRITLFRDTRQLRPNWRPSPTDQNGGDDLLGDANWLADVVQLPLGWRR